MDEVGVVSYCDLTANVRIEFAGGGYIINPGNINEFIQNCTEKYPDRFYCFTMSEFARPVSEPLFEDHVRFVDEFIKTLQQHVEKGAKGLKVLKELGLHYRIPNGALIFCDDERLFPIWEEAAKLKIPVLIHQTDPTGFFEPVNPENEHYESLIKYPTWSFADSRISSQAYSSAKARKPDQPTSQHYFYFTAFANMPENISYVSRLLDENPNVYIDFSAGLMNWVDNPILRGNFLSGTRTG